MSRPLSPHETSIQTTEDVVLLNTRELKQPCVRYRYLLAILSSFGFMMAQGTRTSLNIALVAMVNYTAESPTNHSGGQCPQSQVQHNRSLPQKQGQFDWDGTVQSQLLSAFYYGYVVTQLPGGCLAERVGSTWVFGFTVLIPGILSLLHPLLAHWDYRALLAARVIMGLCQGPLFPSNQALWGQWAPPLERSRLATLSTAGSFIGILISLVLTGYLSGLPYLGGWPLAFYVWGTASCVWFILWRIFSADTPNKCRMISAIEREYIESSIGYLDTKPYVKPPWCEILRSRAIWALAIYFLFDGIGYFVIFTGFPIYMKQALGFNISLEGEITALPPLASVIISLLTSVLADYVLSKHWFSTTTVRKIFTLIGESSMALAVVAIGLADCNHVLVVILYIVGYGLSGISGSGVGVITLDMAPQYAGTLLGITNLINSCGGFLGPAFVSLVTDNEGDKYRWQLMFYLTGGCFMLALLPFLLFGSASVQSWAVITSELDDSDDDNGENSGSQNGGDHVNVTGQLLS